MLLVLTLYSLSLSLYSTCPLFSSYKTLKSKDTKVRLIFCQEREAASFHYAQHSLSFIYVGSIAGRFTNVTSIDQSFPV